MVVWKEKIRNRLEEQAKQIEAVLNGHRVSAVVTGGVVYPSFFEFTVQGPTRRVSALLTSLKDEIASVLNAPQVEIECQEDGMTVRVMQWNSYPLLLLDLMRVAGKVRPMTMILGAGDDGSPLMLHLPTADVDNILIIGSEGAGKTGLLRALLFSLAARNRQHHLQAAVIDYDPAASLGADCKGPLAAFGYLPHLIEPVVTTLPGAIRVLDFLAREVDYRLQKEIELPRILLAIDNLDNLLAAGQEPLMERLIYLLENGASVGIHLILALEKPVGPFTRLLMKCSFPVRFIGRVRNEKMARAAAGIPETGAEQLEGQGDFIAVKDGYAFSFQTAYISDYDLYLAVDALSRQRGKKMVLKASGNRSYYPILTSGENRDPNNIVT